MTAEEAFLQAQSGGPVFGLLSARCSASDVPLCPHLQPLQAVLKLTLCSHEATDGHEIVKFSSLGWVILPVPQPLLVGTSLLLKCSLCKVVLKLLLIL